MWNVNNKVHETSGYWGPVDTTHAFCEPHYAVTPWVAEFHNAWSSLVFCVVGMYIAIQMNRRDIYVKVIGLWLALIGLGSLLFHGTMKYSMQLMDELPMIGFMLTTMLAKATVTTRTTSLSSSSSTLNGKKNSNNDQHHHVTPNNREILRRYRGLIVAWIWFQCLAVAGLYLYFDIYAIFYHGFTLLVVTDWWLGFLLHHRHHHYKSDSATAKEKEEASSSSSSFLLCVFQNRARTMGTVAILLGRVAWEIENRLCGHDDFSNNYAEWVWPLHAVWHFCAAAGAYYSSVGTLLCRVDATNVKDKFPPNLLLFELPIIIIDNDESDKTNNINGGMKNEEKTKKMD